jgi:hypothetical protein
MHLLLRKTERDDGWFSSSINFILEARLDLTEDEQEFFSKYGLHDVAVYDSAAREAYAEQALENYQAGVEHGEAIPIFPGTDKVAAAVGNAFASMWYLAVGAGYSLLSASSFRITLQSLVDGQEMESQSLEEILTIARHIEEAAQYLADYFTLALTFAGEETLREFK